MRDLHTPTFDRPAGWSAWVDAYRRSLAADVNEITVQRTRQSLYIDRDHQEMYLSRRPISAERLIRWASEVETMTPLHANTALPVFPSPAQDDDDHPALLALAGGDVVLHYY